MIFLNVIPSSELKVLLTQLYVPWDYHTKADSDKVFHIILRTAAQHSRLDSSGSEKVGLCDDNKQADLESVANLETNSIHQPIWRLGTPASARSGLAIGFSPTPWTEL